MLERDRIVEITAAVGSVLIMLGAMSWVGLTYGTGQFLGEDGAPMMIATIVGFIVLVTVVGTILAFTVSDPTPPDEDADAAS
ncbi:DUF7472 family protein [Halovivax gelatinilyticus]|uniref:DUF7472 family protein n=1 Tax=Halovivax gelatinilyticus TaxID=2961597 RepID=UPI0020CA3F49|nr:hypothetical protein [Halovivax gelatinilyticus]